MTDQKPHPLRQRIARAIHRYDNEHALSGNDIPGTHHYGEADAVLVELRAELGEPGPVGPEPAGTVDQENPVTTIQPGQTHRGPDPRDGPRTGDRARLEQLRTQLAAEADKARAADQRARPDLLITPHSGIAAGLDIALHYIDYHLRETERDGGPTVREAAADDRAHWAQKYDG